MDKWIVSLIIVISVGILSMTGCGKDPVRFVLGEGGVYKKEEGGSTWNKAGLSRKTVFFLGFNPHRPQILYAGTKDGPAAGRRCPAGAPER